MMLSLVPFNNFGSLSTSMDNLFNQVMSDVFGKSHKWEVGKSSYPRINTLEYDDKVVVEAAVPGLTKDDIKVEWNNDILTISGESQYVIATKDLQSMKNQIKISESGTYGYRELHKSSFIRSFSLYEDEFEVEKIDAKVENGLLTISIPKKSVKIEKEKVRKIQIK